ncbi:MAG: RibD family protein [Verrucomicrobia bacterium]|nr:RibD family protein [Verrucomicrobiota bacterium]
MPRPKVLINFALTVDGKISTASFTPTTFTSAYDKRRLLEIRSLGDAIMVGRGTLEKDRMTMGMPDAELRRERKDRGQTEYPLRVILSGSGKLDLNLPVFGQKFSPILLFTGSSIETEVPWPDHVRVHRSERDWQDPDQVLSFLYAEYGVRTLVCEGGPTLIRALAQRDLIDEIYATIVPKLFGGEHAPGLLGISDAFLSASRAYRMMNLEVHGDEAYLHYRRDR